jgi:CheY-like chemotaxis protein
MLVLIVDDSRLIRRLERDVLAQFPGVETVEAADGVAALRELAARGFQVDLILLDWKMPRMDGLTLAKHLKGHENLRGIPIVMVTSCADEARMREARAAGVDGYLLKPFTRELFLQALAGLARRQVPAESPLAAASPGPEGSEMASFLAQLDNALRGRILMMSVLDEFEAGATVLAAGSPVEAFLFVCKGSVEEEARELGFGSITQRCYTPGECFGVTELMSGDAVASSFVAKERSTVGRLSKPAFEGMILKFPEIGVTLSRFLAAKARQLDASGQGSRGQLAGALEVLDLPALIQALHLRQTTCVVELPELSAELGFVDGELVSAQLPGKRGKDALLAVLERGPKSFRCRVEPSTGERNLHENTMSLLLDCTRQLDERVAAAG